MADVQTFTSWSSTANTNKPAGTDVIGAGLDDNLREIQAQVAAWRDGTGYGILTVSTVAGTNTITGTTSPAPTLAANQKFLVVPAATNTGSTFANFNSGGNKAVFSGGATCVGGELVSAVPSLWEYDGTQYNILTPVVPVPDSNAIVKGSSDGTKKFRIEVDGFTTGQTRTLTPPDADLTISALTAKGAIWSASSTGVANTLPVGPDGQVLTADASSVGGVKWAIPGLNLLCPAKVASVSASVSFTSADFDWTLYDEYEFHIVGLRPATDAVYFTCNISTDGGSTWKTGASDYAWAYHTTSSGAAATDNGNNGDSRIVLADQETGLTNNSTYAGRIIIRFPTPSAVFVKALTVDGAYTIPTTFQQKRYTGSGQYVNATTAINGIRFQPNTGNISVGTFYAYGIRKS